MHLHAYLHVEVKPRCDVIILLSEAFALINPESMISFVILYNAHRQISVTLMWTVSWQQHTISLHLSLWRTSLTKVTDSWTSSFHIWATQVLMEWQYVCVIVWYYNSLIKSRYLQVDDRLYRFGCQSIFSILCLRNATSIAFWQPHSKNEVCTDSPKACSQGHQSMTIWCPQEYT